MYMLHTEQLAVHSSPSVLNTKHNINSPWTHSSKICDSLMPGNLGFKPHIGAFGSSLWERIFSQKKIQLSCVSAREKKRAGRTVSIYRRLQRSKGLAHMHTHSLDQSFLQSVRKRNQGEHEDISLNSEKNWRLNLPKRRGIKAINQMSFHPS